MKILIIDDEKNEREALKKLILANCSDISDIFLSSNGEDGIRLFKKYSPDIVFVDINMAGINGLEAVKKMQDYSNRGEFIIVSAYNLFAYAKEAIKLRVWDFLVKPVGPIEVKILIENIAKKSKTQEYSLKLIEKIENINQLVEENFVRSVASINLNFDICSIQDYIDQSVQIGQVAVVKTSSFSHAEINQIKGYWKKSNVTCMSCNCTGFQVFVLLSQNELKKEHITEWIEKNNWSVFGCFGLGHCSPIGDGLRESFHQAIRAHETAVANGTKICFFETTNFQKTHAVNIKAIANKVSGMILERKYEDAQLELNSSLDQMQKYYSNQSFALNTYRLMMYICDKLEMSEDMAITSYMQSISIASGRLVIRELVNQIFKVMINKINSTESKKADDLSGTIKHIIEQEYMNELTLETIADRLHYSAYYLSRIFSKDFEMTFVEYLTQFRIEKAKELMKYNESLSIKEVANSVGFHSQAYFARVFKKYCGISPTEFKN